MVFLRWLSARREARERAGRDACDLILFLGDHAYGEARERDRTCRDRLDSPGYRHWSRVAVEIAGRVGHRIGERADDRRAADREGRGSPRPPVPPKREIIAGLVAIAAGIADLAHGRVDLATLHNARARVMLVVDMAGATPELALIGEDVSRALDELAAAAPENRAALAEDVYPPRAEAAGFALQRLREALSLAAGIPARN